LHYYYYQIVVPFSVYIYIYIYIYIYTCVGESVVGVANRYWLDGPGIESRCG
jgi:hypothetical protein